MKYPGIKDFLERYAKKAAEAKVDPLGFYLPPFNYAIGQMLEQAMNGTKSLDQKKLAEYLRKNEMKTIVGPIKLRQGRRVGQRRAWCRRSSAAWSTRTSSSSASPASRS